MQHIINQRGLWTLAVAFGALAPWSCRSKLDVQTQNSTVAPVSAGTGTSTSTSAKVAKNAGTGTGTSTSTGTSPNATEMAAALMKIKTTFQSRDVIKIAVDKSMFAGAPTYTVLNVSDSGTDDTKAIKLAANVPVAFNLDEYGAMLADPDFTGKLVVKFNPGQKTSDGKAFFKAGVNKIKVIANNPAAPAFVTTQITVSDFPVFSPLALGFATNVQTAPTGDGSGQFQGWLNVVSAGTVSASDDSQLAAGLSNMINSH